MHPIRQTRLRRLLAILATLLIWKVTLSVVAGYRHYFPPNFDADFLLGRQSYFWGGYHWAFYTHLIVGPSSLLLGTLLVSDRFRRKFPHWHRRLGRAQAMVVLLLVAPSGLWMALYAPAGPIAASGLAALAVATAACVALGWKAAVARRFDSHRLWMGRSYMLLCSAVVIRLIGGLATVTQFDAAWLNPLAAWTSWLVPLAAFEIRKTVLVRASARPAISGSIH